MNTKQCENVIMTVKGPISSNHLGFCHSHEHLFIADGHSAKVNATLRVDDLSKTIAELNLFNSAGGTSIIDAQPVGCSRMAKYLIKASTITGINIIASSGFHKLIFYPSDHWIHSIDQDKFTEILTNEFKYGMYIDADNNYPLQHIDAVPGVIKTASDVDGPDGNYRKLFNAAATASINTGTPVLSHTEMGKGALEQIQLFSDHGVPTDAIIICHLDRCVKDISYHLDVAQTGVYMEFDTIGRFKYHSDEDEAKFIIKMVEHGYEDKILIGLDTTRERLKSYGGVLGLDYIKKSFIPLLKDYGLSDEIIEKFTVYNPARAFKKYKISK